MRLSDHDLLQLTEEELLELPEEVLRRLSVKLLYDLKEARERLRQTSKNSSRPPSSDLPWDKADAEPEEPQQPQQPGECTETDEHTLDNSDKASKTEAIENAQDSTDEAQQPAGLKDAESDKRKAGKQPGAPGYGRVQKIAITAEEHHYPTDCARCDRELQPSAAKAYTAFETVDLMWTDRENPGIHVTNTKHTYYETTCDCGHCTQQSPNRQVSHALTPDIILSEWRLVGPGLAALIVCLAYRMRLSRKRTREFLYDWLALEISVGTINATLHESGAAALPIEDELVQAVQDSGLLHVDETSWRELNTLLWLWVFCGQNVVAYWIASRGSELLNNVLGDSFQGWLMSDGWQVYRYYAKRLRCWAHLIRKAEGLKDSLDPTARLFGDQTLLLLNTLIKAVYAARERPPDQPLPITYQHALSDYQSACEVMSASATHEKARTLAVEMLNDWGAIFQVLAHPHLPLTNNEAEQALRHWVILRGICHGTRTEDGTRILAILISVIETCRVRQQSPWIYLAAVIGQRRAGLPIPSLPVAKGSE
jgi:transposase